MNQEFLNAVSIYYGTLLSDYKVPEPKALYQVLFPLNSSTKFNLTANNYQYNITLVHSSMECL